MPAIVTSAEIERPAAEVFAYATTQPGSVSGRRAWWTGTWTVRPTTPNRQPWAQGA